MTPLSEKAFSDICKTTKRSHSTLQEKGKIHEPTENHVVPLLLTSTPASHMSLNSPEVFFPQPSKSQLISYNTAQNTTKITGHEPYSLFRGAFESQHMLLSSFSIEEEDVSSYILEEISLSSGKQQSGPPQYSSVAVTIPGNQAFQEKTKENHPILIPGTSDEGKPASKMLTGLPKPTDMATQLREFLMEPLFEYSPDIEPFRDAKNCTELELTSLFLEKTEVRSPSLDTSEVVVAQVNDLNDMQEVVSLGVSCEPCQTTKLLALETPLFLPWIDISDDEDYEIGYQDCLTAEHLKVLAPVDLPRKVSEIQPSQVTKPQDVTPWDGTVIDLTDAITPNTRDRTERSGRSAHSMAQKTAHSLGKSKIADVSKSTIHWHGRVSRAFNASEKRPLNRNVSGGRYVKAIHIVRKPELSYHAPENATMKQITNPEDKGTHELLPTRNNSARQEKHRRNKRYRQRSLSSSPVDTEYIDSEGEVEIKTTPRDPAPKRKVALNSDFYYEKHKKRHTLAKKTSLHHRQEKTGESISSTRLGFSRIQLGEEIVEDDIGGTYKGCRVYYDEFGREEMWFQMEPI